jgi:hypothetical protein
VASTPAFASTPRLATAQVSTANTARDGTGTLATIITGVAAGTIIERLVIIADNDPADSIVTIFLHDGTNARFFDEFDLNNPAAASTTVPAFRTEKEYSNLRLPSASWTLRAAITVALTAGNINVWALGADLT